MKYSSFPKFHGHKTNVYILLKDEIEDLFMKEDLVDTLDKTSKKQDNKTDKYFPRKDV